MLICKLALLNARFAELRHSALSWSIPRYSLSIQAPKLPANERALPSVQVQLEYMEQLIARLSQEQQQLAASLENSEKAQEELSKRENAALRKLDEEARHRAGMLGPGLTCLHVVCYW